MVLLSFALWTWFLNKLLLFLSTPVSLKETQKWRKVKHLKRMKAETKKCQDLLYAKKEIYKALYRKEVIYFFSSLKYYELIYLSVGCYIL